MFPASEFATVGEFTRERLGNRGLTATATRELSAATVKQMLDYPWFFIANFVYTVAKDTEEVLVDPWVGQSLLYFVREVQRRLGFAQRIVEIKPRQVGWTTMILAMAFQQMFRPRTKALILVNDDDVAEDLMLKVNVMYNALPSALVPMKRKDNAKLLVFDNPDPRSRERRRGFSSTFNITTPSAMRGKTPNILGISEAAHNPRLDEVMEGLVQAMPIDEHSCVFLDTTPAGFDDIYYPLVCEAVERNPVWVSQWERRIAPTREQVFQGALGIPDRPGEGWVPVFIPWFWHEQYGTKEDHPQGQLQALEPKQKQYIKDTLGKLERYGGDEELELHRKYGVSYGRLAWRRYKLDNAGNSDIAVRLLTFRQEFAATWHSCFVEYNHSPFDRLGLEALTRMQRLPQARGKLRHDPQGRTYLDQTWHSEWEETRIYVPPEADERYVIGVDTASAYESKNADDSVAVVLRRRDDRVVAVYQAKVPPHMLRDQIALLYYWYNKAYLAIETESVGYALPRQLYDMGVRNQYYWKRMDKDIPTNTDYLGWETNPKSRPDMESTLVELISRRDPDGKPAPDLIIHDRVMLQQLQSMKRYPDGRIRGQGKAHDDHVLALMIALQAARDPFAPMAKPHRPAPPEAPADRLRSAFGNAFRPHVTHTNRPRYESL